MLICPPMLVSLIRGVIWVVSIGPPGSAPRGRPTVPTSSAIYRLTDSLQKELALGAPQSSPARWWMAFTMVAGAVGTAVMQTPAARRDAVEAPMSQTPDPRRVDPAAATSCWARPIGPSPRHRATTGGRPPCSSWRSARCPPQWWRRCPGSRHTTQRLLFGALGTWLVVLWGCSWPPTCGGPSAGSVCAGS